MEDAACRVCTIALQKDRRELTPAERKIADRCRTLYTVGFLCIVGGLIGLFLLLPAFFYYLAGRRSRNLVTPTPFLPYYVMGMGLIGLLTPVMGLMLRRYKKGSRPFGILLFGTLVALNLPGFHLFPVLGGMLILYWIASPPSREILMN
jgi:hypothetical protein